MIKVFDSKETNFKHCKYVLNQWISLTMYESVDGRFYIEGEYPLDGRNSDMLVRGNIISTPSYDDRPNQLFKIRKPSRKITSTSKTLGIYADAIGRTDADNNYIPGIEIPKGKTRKQALQLLYNSRADKRRSYYIGNLDKSTNTNVNLGIDDEGKVINYIDMADKSLLKCLLEETTDKTNSSLYTAYKGEIIWNNFEVNMVDERGSGTEFIIKSGKNLQEIEEDIDDTTEDFATALIMCSSDGLYLPNQEIIYAPNANDFDRYFFKSIKCDDVSFEDLVTENSTEKDIEDAKKIVYAQLRERASQKFKEGINILPANYTIKYAELENTEEYKDKINILKKATLGNNVKTIYKKYNIESKGRILGITCNLLRLNNNGKPRIEEVEIGQRLKKDIATTINNTSNTANTANTTANDANNAAKKAQKYVSILKDDVTVEFGEINGKFQTVVKSDELGSLIEAAVDHILLAVNNASGETGLEITRENGVVVYNGKLQIFTSKDKRVFWITQKGDIHLNEAGAIFIDDTILQRGSLQFNTPEDIVAEMSAYKDGINFDCPIYVNHTKIT